MMGGVSPETCWALYKYEIDKKNLIHCCILLGILCELYYDARIHEHHVFSNTCGIHDLSFVDLVSLSEIPEQIQKKIRTNT